MKKLNFTATGGMRILIVCMLAVAVMVVCPLFVCEKADSIVYGAASGDCGENATFEVDAEGVLTIRGSGEITAQKSASKYPWNDQWSKITKIVIGEGITSVPKAAFSSGTNNLKTLELPATLTSFAIDSIASAHSIDTITVGEGGTYSAENNVLYGSGQTSVITAGKAASGEIVLPLTVTKLENNAFDGCKNITGLTLPSGLESVGNYAFRNTELTSLQLPNTVTSIGIHAFAGMTKLSGIEIPSGVTELSNYMFNGCSALETVVFKGKVTKIGTYVFQKCTSLTEVTLPDDLTTIGASAFAGCTALKNVNIPSGVKILGTSATSSSVFLNCESLEEIALPNGLTTIGASSFKGCKSLKSIDIPDSVKTIESMAFQQCESLTAVVVPEGVTTLKATFAGCINLKTVDLPDTLTTLTAKSPSNPGVFSDCKSLEEINIPSRVTAITTETFKGCSSLKDLGIGEGITTIGQSAYEGCESLVDITIPGTVKTFTGYAFKDCTNLNIVRFGEGMTSFTSSLALFEGCDRLSDIYIPKTLESFQPIVFEKAVAVQRVHTGDNPNFIFEDGVLYDNDIAKVVYITAGYSGKLVLPETVREIGPRCAGYTRALTEVVFPEGLETIGSSAFYYAYGLRKVTLPSTLTEIKDSAFRATGLESIEIPDSVTSVGNNAFTLCEEMTSAKIGEGLTDIPVATFLNCKKLSDLTLPEKLKTIGNQAFSGISVPEIEIPEGVTTIGATALANNTNLNSVVLPDSITSIPSTAFNGDTGLKYIYYKGTEEQWSALKCTPAYGTVVCNYKGVDEDLAGAVIKTQPVAGTYEKGAEPEDLTVEVEPVGIDGEVFYYTWYKNNTDSIKNGVTVEGTSIENGMKCTPTTSKIGTEYYYCVITRMVNGYAAERVISNIVPVTVKMSLEGSGSEKDPFLVNNADELQIVNDMVKAENTLSGVFIKMTDDITLPSGWEPIGALKEGETGSGQGKNVNPFSGTFDGDGHTITVPENGKPLFGYVRNATIKNLNIYGEKIDGTGLVNHYERDYETGSSQSEFGSDAKYIVTIENVTLKAGTKTRESGLIGENNNSQDASSMNPVLLVSCKAEKGVEIGYNHDESQIGTFAGRVCGTIINCVSDADVYGTDRVGGIVGCQDVAMGVLHVINSAFHGEVHATGNFVGGIAGSGYRGSAPNALCVEINNCYVDGTVNGNDYVGGIFGAEDEVAQCWSNGKGYINNNSFTGILNSAQDAKYVGGVIGYYRSLNKYTYFSNNFFKEGTAQRGIGGAQFVDTVAVHENASDITYIDTTNNVSGCPHVQFCDWKSGLARDDDPFGTNKDDIAADQTEDELLNGTTVAKLNSGSGSMKNWKVGEKGYPVFGSDPVVYEMKIEGDIKNKYFIGEEFDTNNVNMVLSWTDGKTTEVPLAEAEIEGFDNQKRGVNDVTITYAGISKHIEVTVLKEDDGSKIKVTISVLGDDDHDSDIVHTLKRGNLTPWIEEREVEAGINDTCLDILKSVLEEENYELDITSDENYVAGIGKSGEEVISEFTNGAKSGWMYTLNGEHSQLMLRQQFLEDGDEIVMHYTDDYTLEEDSLDASDALSVIDSIEAAPDDPEELTNSTARTIVEAKRKYDTMNPVLKGLLSNAEKEKLENLSEPAEFMVKKADAISELKQLAEDVAGKVMDPNSSDVILLKAIDELRDAKTPAEIEAILQNAKKLIGDMVAEKEEADKKAAEDANAKDDKADEVDAEAKAKKVKKVTVNVKTVNKKAVDKAVKKAGGSNKYVTTIVLGKKVKKVSKNTFKTYKKVKTIEVKTKKLTKKSAKGSLKGSKVKTVKVKVGKKAVNKKYVKKYKKIFTKKNAGKKVIVKS